VLCRYRELRVRVAPACPVEALFVSGRGKAYGHSYVGSMFRHIAAQAGLRCPTGRGPRLHDLRATFAVTRLLEVSGPATAPW
jgi:integrase